MLLTAYSDPEYLEAAKAAGVQGYLVKPLNNARSLISQYTSRAYHHKLVQAGITQSMFRAAHCIDNGLWRNFVAS